MIKNLTESESRAMDYPDWPSKISLESVSRKIFLEDSIPLKNIYQLEKGIPSWACYYKNIPLYFKEEFDGLGRKGLIRNEIEVMYEVNKLREFIPNFEYGYFICQNNSYHFKELPLTPGRDLLIAEFISGPLVADIYKPHRDRLFSNLVQVIASIEIAKQTIGLVHNDLTPRNMVFKKLKKKSWISYNGLIIEDTHIPVIFDFDRSKIGGESKDIPNFIKTYLGKSYPDIYSFYGLRRNKNRTLDTTNYVERPVQELVKYLEQRYCWNPVKSKCDLLTPTNFI